MNYSPKFFIILIFSILTTISSFSQLYGDINVGTGETFTTLTGSGGLFSAINSTGLSGNLTVRITSDISETGSNALNQWSSSYAVTIVPSAAVTRKIYGSANSLINFNGADRVTIDGRFEGSGKYLRFVNTASVGSTIKFTNDAIKNTVTYCSVEGANGHAFYGTIHLGTSSEMGARGNDSNTISYCDIREPADSPPGYPITAIYSDNYDVTLSTMNSNNFILNNNIFNFYRQNDVSSGILLTRGSTDFVISGNSFYQTATRTNTTGSSCYVIRVYTVNANNMTISNNFIGGSAPNCGGAAWTTNGSTGNNFVGIGFSNGGTITPSNVNGNIIANINFLCIPAVSAIYFSAIYVSAAGGLVNIGTTAGNTIGNTNSNGNITINYNGFNSDFYTRMINHQATGNVSNNIIGSINLGYTGGTGILRFDAIYCANTPSQAITISNNIIGSTTVPGSIQTTSNFPAIMSGINSQVNGVDVTISGNTIANLSNSSTNSSARQRGIFQNTGTTGRMIILNNTVQDIYGAGAGVGNSTDRYPNNCAVIGIFTGSSYSAQVVTGNTIKGIRNTGNFDNYVQGFGFYNSAGGGTFSKNKIYDLTTSSTSNAPKIYGINSSWGAWSIINNQISITNSEFTSKAEIKGINEESQFGSLYYYNSVYIGGSNTSGFTNSWAWDRPLASWSTPVSLRNNLFVNARTGGTGKHFAIGNEIDPPATNWTGATANYNVYISSNANTVGNWGTSSQTIEDWKSSSSGDKQTWSTTSGSLSLIDLFEDASAGNLNIKSSNYEAWIVYGKGLAISGQSQDYNGYSRPTTISEGCSDIGANELLSIPPGCPSATADIPPGPGVTSTYTLWGRTISVINWGSGGSSYPSSLDIRYFSGVTNPNALSGKSSNSYWSVSKTGELTGASYNIEFYFSDNETYVITEPSINTRLAKFESSWEIYAAGSGPGQTQLSWNSGSGIYKVYVSTLFGFSDFVLTDESNPLPVEMCSFTASVSNRSVMLHWITCSELNNAGFEVERKNLNASTNGYNEWVKTGFAEGYGTVNQQSAYNYVDGSLATGKYLYRLKQIDYNGNFEYHNLSNPSEVVIGKPVTADIFQSYPNPSNPSSKVDFQLQFDSKVSLKVYDITGREVAVLVNGQLAAGYYTANINGSNIASGLYFYSLIVEFADGQKFSKTMKMVIIK